MEGAGSGSSRAAGTWRPLRDAATCGMTRARAGQGREQAWLCASMLNICVCVLYCSFEV